MMQASSRRGILFVISAPSGAGKTSLARGVVQSRDDLAFSVSYTTRPRRSGEEQGREYHFIDDAEFDRMLRDDAFLEWAEVFGARYGTGRAETDRGLADGRDLVLDVDVQGAEQIQRRAGGDAVLIFVLPPDYPTLEKRLRERAREGDREVSRRLAEAGREVRQHSRYDYLVVNDDLEQAVRVLDGVVTAERHRAGRLETEAERILNTFPPLGGSDG